MIFFPITARTLADDLARARPRNSAVLRPKASPSSQPTARRDTNADSRCFFQFCFGNHTEAKRQGWSTSTCFIFVGSFQNDKQSQEYIGTLDFIHFWRFTTNNLCGIQFVVEVFSDLACSPIRYLSSLQSGIWKPEAEVNAAGYERK